MIYLGPALFVFLLGLLLLAIGAITLAVAVWRSGVLSRWAGVLFALDVGGTRLAASLERKTRHGPASHRPWPQSPTGVR